MSATFQITPEMRRARTRQNAAKYLAYWPGDQWFFDEYGGNPQWLPPDLESKMIAHPVERDRNGAPVMYKANGERTIENFYGTLYGKKAAPVNGYWQRPILDREALIFTAEEIITQLVKKHEARGLVELTGDPEMDVHIKREAKDKWLKSQREWAQNELNARREFIETYKKEHPGTTSFPAPKESQIRAEIIMLRLEMGTASGTRAKYVCDCGMFEHDEKALFDMHRQARHGEKPVEEPVAVAAPVDEEEPDFMANPQPEDAVINVPKKRGPGRPRKDEQAS
jgi:hypothetical protein